MPYTKLNGLLLNGRALASFALCYVANSRQRKLVFVLLAKQGITDACSQTRA